MLDSDRGKELSLRNFNHPWLSKASPKFLRNLGHKVHFIRRICPGKFRLEMLAEDFRKACCDKYSTLKSFLKHTILKDRIPNYWDCEHLLEDDFMKFFLHDTICDELILEIAEIMFWCEEMCESHPYIMKNGPGELTQEIIYIGCIYLLQTGLDYDNKYPIIEKHPLLSRRGYLVPQNMLGQLLTNRKNVGIGTENLKNVLLSLCKIRPLEQVSFLYWKKNLSQLYQRMEIDKI